MTAHDTHTTRLALWPRLSTFPTTNGMLVLVMTLWALTCVGAIADSVYASVAVPDRWYQALEVFTGIVVLQFIGKRSTDSQLWRGKPRQKKEPPANG